MRSISLKLQMGMMLLVAAVLVLMWLFQVVFLERYYVRQRINEVEDKGTKIAANINELSRDELIDSIDSFAHDYNCSVTLFDASGRIAYSSSMTRQIPGVTQGYLRNELFSKASSGERIYLSVSHPRFDSRYILLGLPTKATGAMFIVFPLAPVEDTVAILKTQIIYILAILFVISLLISYIISRKLIKPLLVITNATTKMASGDFDTRIKSHSKDEIGRLSDAINHLGRELAKTEKLRRDFIANVSHELRTPLSLIKGYAETIRDVSGEDKEKRIDQLDIIIEESDRLSGIVNDILYLSKIQQEPAKIKKERFELASLISSTAAKYQIMKTGSGITLDFDINDPVYVTGDEEKIEQVLHNLISNAIDHSGSKEAIRIALIPKTDHVRVEISDKGRGISKEELIHIWDRFYKSTTKTQGSGLGLAIVKSILDAHKSEYGASSEPDKKTVFWFSLDISH